MHNPWGLQLWRALLVFSSVAASLQFANSDFDVRPDEPFTIKFNDVGSKTAKLSLLSGEPTDLKEVQVLIENATGPEETITLSSRFPSGTYAFRLTDADDGTNTYSEQFEFKGSATSLAPEETTTAPTESPPLETNNSKESETSTEPTPLETNTSETTSTPEPAPSEGLTTGQKAGIGVGAGLGGLLLLALLGLFLYRRGQAKGMRTASATTTKQASPKLDDEHGLYSKAELGGMPVSELDSTLPVSELESALPPSELESPQSTERSDLKSPEAFDSGEEDVYHDVSKYQVHNTRRGRSELP